MWDTHRKTLDYCDNYYSQECHALLRKQKLFKFYRMPPYHFLRMHIPPKAPDIYTCMHHNNIIIKSLFFSQNVYCYMLFDGYTL